MIFAIDFRHLILSLLPYVLRTQRLYNYIDALIVPIKVIYNAFYVKQEKNLMLAKVTPQTSKMKNFLNILFDSNERRINIIDLSSERQTFVYLSDERKPLYLPTFISVSTNFGNYDFLVEVPNDIAQRENEIWSVVNAVKLPTKRFKIVIV